MSKIVRNPLRGKAVYEKSEYVPEWVRIGAAPIEYAGVQKDFRMLPKKSQKPERNVNVRRNARPVEEDVREGTSFERDGSHKIKKPIDFDSIPSTPPPLYSREGCPPPKQYSNSIIPADSSELDESHFDLDSEQEGYTTFQDDTDYIEIDDQQEEDIDEDEVTSFHHFKPSDFALLIHGQIIYVSSQLSQMESMIESIIHNGYEGEEVNMDDLILIRRIPLKMGVLAIL